LSHAIEQQGTNKINGKCIVEKYKEKEAAIHCVQLNLAVSLDYLRLDQNLIDTSAGDVAACLGQRKTIKSGISKAQF
jgi:hypothetical protein